MVFFSSNTGDTVVGKGVATKVCVRCEFLVVGLGTKSMAMISPRCLTRIDVK